MVVVRWARLPGEGHGCGRCDWRRQIGERDLSIEAVCWHEDGADHRLAALGEPDVTVRPGGDEEGLGPSGGECELLGEAAGVGGRVGVEAREREARDGVPASSVTYSVLSGPSATLLRRLPASGENHDKPPVEASRPRRSLDASMNQTAVSPRFNARLTGCPTSTPMTFTAPEVRSIEPMRSHPSAAHQTLPSFAQMREVGLQAAGRAYSPTIVPLPEVGPPRCSCGPPFRHRARRTTCPGRPGRRLARSRWPRRRSLPWGCPP